MSRFKLLIVFVTALGLAAPAMAHHKDGEHVPPGNANGHSKADNLNKGKGHGTGDINHGEKHGKWMEEEED